VNYRSGTSIHSGTMREGMEPPSFVWVPSIGVSGLLLYTGDKFPEWRGSLFAGGMVGEQLVRLTFNGPRPELAEILLRRQGRIRDVRQGPDGYIYLAIDNRQGGPTPVVRLEPVPRN
jgi:glucose/arabinose dehydrogenase